jgi:hypothetical protein
MTCMALVSPVEMPSHASPRRRRNWRVSRGARHRRENPREGSEGPVR